MKFSHKLFVVLFVTLFVQNTAFLFGHVILPPNENSTITLTEDLYAALSSQRPTVILGFMDHCPHCKTLMPFFEKLEIKYPKARFFTVNGPQLSLHKLVAQLSDNKFKIPGFPSVVFVKNRKIVDLQIGGNKDTLEEKIKKLLK